jgi:hypothetical protein
LVVTGLYGDLHRTVLSRPFHWNYHSSACAQHFLRDLAYVKEIATRPVCRSKFLLVAKPNSHRLRPLDRGIGLGRLGTQFWHFAWACQVERENVQASQWAWLDQVREGGRSRAAPGGRTVLIDFSDGVRERTRGYRCRAGRLAAPKLIGYSVRSNNAMSNEAIPTHLLYQKVRSG